MRVRWALMERVTLWALVVWLLGYVHLLDSMVKVLFDTTMATRNQLDAIMRLLHKFVV